MSFSKGLLVGGLLGTAYALLTASTTGPKRQQAIARYLNELSESSTDVQQSAVQLQTASQNLSNELKTTAVTSLSGISDALQTFSFEAAPRIAQIEESVDRLTQNLKK
ncbi:YtxH domain-containing protein [Latilactobacillus curvatus]|uniref:YtxH domain-containing protein n=1 Tax=Latilactobacillus curvatus TaxID=28038 RepID=UPI0039AF5093